MQQRSSSADRQTCPPAVCRLHPIPTHRQAGIQADIQKQTCPPAVCWPDPTPYTHTGRHTDRHTLADILTSTQADIQIGIQTGRHIERHRQTCIQTGRHTDRQADIQTGRHSTGTQADIHRQTQWDNDTQLYTYT